MNTSVNKLSNSQLFALYVIEAKTELLKTFRTPGFVLPSVLFPVMFYLFFGVIFAMNTNTQMSAYLLATYGVFGVMGPALFSFGAAVAVEKDRGMLAIKQISPMPILAYFFAKVVTALSFAIIIMTILFAVALTLGNVELRLTQWLASFAILMVGVLPFCAIGLSIGLKVKAQAAAAVVNLIYLPMSFLSGLWIPVTQFPEFLQQFAAFLPPFHFAQLVLKVQGMDTGIAWWIHILALMAYTVIFTVFASRAYKANDSR